MRQRLGLFLATLTLGLLFACTSYAVRPKSLNDVRIKALPGTVALTFDDGPSPEHTPQVLSILKKHDVKATFFVMGWAAKKHSELITQAFKAGHVIASHTTSHHDLTRLSDKNLRYEITMPKKVITDIIDKPPVCLRPPYGKGNKRVAKVIAEYDMIMVPLGFNSFDYENRGVPKLVDWVVSNAKSGRVFLLHDGYKYRHQTVKALPGIIEGIRKKGLGFSTICNPPS